MPDVHSQTAKSVTAYLVTAGVVAGTLVLLLLHLRLPSWLNPSGPRWVDLTLLLLPERLFSGTFGSGDLAIGWSSRIPICLLAVSWLFYCWLLGQSISQSAMNWLALRNIERVVIGTLCGLSIASTTTLVIGWLGLIHNSIVFIVVHALVLIAVRLFCVKDNRQFFSLFHATTSESSTLINKHQGWGTRLVSVTVVFLATLSILCNLTAPYEFDVVAYHLQGPKEFYQNGKIEFSGHNVYLNMPLGIEMHTLSMMAMPFLGTDRIWIGALAGKLITGLHGILLLTLVWSIVADRQDRWAGWGAAGLLLSSIGFVVQQGTGLIDIAMTTYGVASMWLCLKCLQRDDSPPAQVLFVSGILAGAAAAAKYTGFIFFALPLVIFWVGMRLRKNSYDHSHLKTLCLVLSGISCIASPWLIKNLLATGNPVFPLALDIFGSGNLNPDQVVRWQNAHSVPGSEAGFGASYGLGAMMSGFKQVFESAFLPVSLLPLCILGSWFGWRRRDRDVTELFWLIGAFWIFGVWWFATHRIDRFWLPCLPMLAIVGGSGLTWLAQRVSANFASALVILSVLMASVSILSGGVIDHRVFVSLSELRADIGTPKVPGRLSPPIDWINQELPNARMLLVGEGKVFDFAAPCQYATCFNTNPGKNWLAANNSEALVTNGITHVYVNWSEIARYRSPGNYGFDAWATKEYFDQLVRQGMLSPVDRWPFDEESGSLYSVIPPDLTPNGEGTR